MQRIAKKGLVLAAATGGLVLSGVGYASADAGASGAATNSPGVLSGNVVQVPIHVPVNICGNSIDIVALINPAFGNKCENNSGHHRERPGIQPHSDAPAADSQAPNVGSATAPTGEQAAPASFVAPASSTPAGQAVASDPAGREHRATSHSGGGAGASGVAANSPGVLSGNLLQVPIDIPVNVCGNTIDIVGLLNPVFGNTCVNNEGHRHTGGGTGGVPTGGDTGVPGGGLTGGGPGGDIGGPGGDIGGPGGDIGGPGGDIGGPGGGAGGDIGGPGGDIGGPGGGAGGDIGGPAEPTEALASTGVDGMLLAPIGGALLIGGLVSYRRFRTRAQG